MYLKKGKKITLPEPTLTVQDKSKFPASISKQEIELKEISNESNKKKELLICREKQSKTLICRTSQLIKTTQESNSEEKQKGEQTIIQVEVDKKPTDDTDLKILDFQLDIKKTAEDDHNNNKINNNSNFEEKLQSSPIKEKKNNFSIIINE